MLPYDKFSKKIFKIKGCKMIAKKHRCGTARKKLLGRATFITIYNQNIKPLLQFLSDLIRRGRHKSEMSSSIAFNFNTHLIKPQNRLKQKSSFLHSIYKTLFSNMRTDPGACFNIQCAIYLQKTGKKPRDTRTSRGKRGKWWK